ncbi:hypothetical protein LIER_23630 [Lithospermum erythrorhizon]|uniref:Uncharacterized protein n=1 Tax=Lithospermum erythrorhizon TaxID=34254 RepID=A0AAV3QYA7_LITER
MSFQDSSITPDMDQDDFDDDNETVGGVEISELLDINNSQTDGLTAAGQSTGALDDPETMRNAYGKVGREKKSLSIRRWILLFFQMAQKMEV